MNVITKAKQAKRESKSIEFKSRFDPASTREWCEILKDVVAISNSGGGTIIIGLDNHGFPSQEDISAVIAMDPASIPDRVFSYTGVHFSACEVLEDTKDGWPIMIFKIDASAIPIVFTKPGTYEIEGTSRQRQRTAFSQGQVYFRHGAKSEPGNYEDLRKVIDKNLNDARKAWLDRVKMVTTAPTGSVITVTARDAQEDTSSDAFRVRVVNDPDAPGFRAINPDDTHPHRQSELIALVNLHVPNGTPLNSWDAFIAKKLYQIDLNKEFCHHPKYSAPQYSDACLQWFVDELSKNPQFFAIARETFRDDQN